VVDQPATGPVMLAFADTAIDIGDRLKARGPATVAIPLRCFAAKGARTGSVFNAFRLSTKTPLELTLRSVALDHPAAAERCAGQ
jgi:hypothetical protein